jgi:hypothetical protein
VLDRHGWVQRRGRTRRRAQGTALSLGQRPNELWCTDYNPSLLLPADGHRPCQPLLVMLRSTFLYQGKLRFPCV